VHAFCLALSIEVVIPMRAWTYGFWCGFHEQYVIVDLGYLQAYTLHYYQGFVLLWGLCDNNDMFFWGGY